jgi:eukaryotic-like serine/threonine-protein kinase
VANLYAGNLVGHTLGNRFRLTALLGTGASARVYLATDTRLRRQVAVKLLHASLASDEAFLRRFQREAEVLAPLSHPNIVIVHDVNHRSNALGEPPYLVTEYLAGGSLRNLLDSGYQLDPSQATVVGLGAARGLAFAHNHGLVHRDIKPANLLFGDDQRVRVSDFGLARALADQARTEPEGALVGTTRYISAEQARGRNTDGRSDVYSLALVLYESVIGQVPFTADTWQGTAMARLDGPVDTPEALGELGPILRAATTVEPADRLDARELVAALEDLARKLPVAASLPLDGSTILAAASVLDQRDPTLFAGSTAPVDFSPKPPSIPGFFDADVDDDVAHPSAAKTPVKPVDSSAKGLRKAQRVEAKAQAEAARRTADAGNKPKRRVATTVLAGLVGAVAAGGAAVGVYALRKTPTRLVPQVTGSSVKSAETKAVDAKFTIVTTPPEFSAAVPAGEILRQDPKAGVRLPEKSVITVTASKGLAPVAVPNLTAITYEQAIAVLRNEGLRFPNPPIYVSNETIPLGQIISWTPQGDVKPGSFISLTVSSGPAAIPLPKLRGLSILEAQALLPPGVTSTVTETFSDVKKGLVASTDPKEATLVKRGDVVTILVSKGQNLVVVPNVINRSPADAAATLRAAGFTIGDTIGPADRPVLHTRPIRNQKVRGGSKITLYTTDQGVPEVPGITDRVAKPAASVKPAGSVKPKAAKTEPATSASDKEANGADAPAPKPTSKPKSTAKPTPSSAP